MHRRHDLIWLSPRGWRSARAQLPAYAAALCAWEQGAWPATVRRADPDAGSDEVSLGISVMQAGAPKLRIGFRAACADVLRITPPLPLASLPPELPKGWAEPVAQLQADTCTLPLHFYGSASLQALTGQPYLNADSDLDLLAYPVSRNQLSEIVERLAFHAGPLPLDGEIVFPSGAAVAWKEWQMALRNASRVLVKDLASVRLAQPATLLGELA